MKQAKQRKQPNIIWRIINNPYVVIHGGVWKVLSKKDQPYLNLVRWRVYETDGIERHLVGYSNENREGRVSSKIMSFDFKNKCGTTRSGRRYKLEGNAGNDRDAAYVWSMWCERNNIDKVRDVTEEYK